MAIGPQGQIFVTWERFTGLGSGVIQLIRNYNGGQVGSWTGTTNVTTFNRFSTCIASILGCIQGYGTPPSTIRVTNYPSIGVDANDTVHIVYADNGTITKGDIKYVNSSNCNKSDDLCNFSTPIKINLDGSAINPNADQFEPILTISTETSPSILHVTVNDRRDDPNNLLWIPYDYYCSLGTNCTSPSNWYNTIILNRQSTNYDKGYFVGDYHGLTFSTNIQAIANWNDHNSTNSTIQYDVWGDKTR